jgi:hypothetical protein
MTEPVGAAPAAEGARFRLAPAALAWFLAGLAVALFAGCLALLFLTRDYSQAAYGSGGAVAAIVALAVGTVVALRQPRNPIGWLLLGWAALVPVAGIAVLYSVLDYRVHGGALPLGRAAVLLQGVEFGVAVLAGLIVLLFPDGRLPSRRWRWVLWAYLGACAVFMASQFTGLAGATAVRPLHVYPTGVPLSAPGAAGAAALAATAGRIAGWLVMAFWLVFAGRLAASYRRSAGLRRHQLRWVLSGAACCAVATAVTIFATDYSYGLAQAVQAAADLGAAALPVGIGVGVVRYRLYDIDRVISRTLAYAIVTGLLVGVYAGVVLLATHVLPVSSPVAVAGATLVVAALFNPLRHRVQRMVDRRFNRARYNAQQTVAAFADRLKDPADLDAVRSELLGAVQQTLEPAQAWVWISGGRS